MGISFQENSVQTILTENELNTKWLFYKFVPIFSSHQLSKTVFFCFFFCGVTRPPNVAFSQVCPNFSILWHKTLISCPKLAFCCFLLCDTHLKVTFSQICPSSCHMRISSAVQNCLFFFAVWHAPKSNFFTNLSKFFHRVTWDSHQLSKTAFFCFLRCDTHPKVAFSQVCPNFSILWHKNLISCPKPFFFCFCFFCCGVKRTQK